MPGENDGKIRMAPLFALGLCGLFTATAADAALEAIEDAYEVELARVELPVHALGQVSFAACAGCDRVSLQVGGDTRYLLAGAPPPLSLGSFREEAARTVDPLDAVVYVIYDTRTGVVTRLVLDRRGR
jgi:hypothetical protein